MANGKEVMSPEIRKRPMGFRHLGSSPFCEGESQTLKLPLMALFTQQTSVFGFVCSTKQKGLGTNLADPYFKLGYSALGNMPTDRSDRSD